MADFENKFPEYQGENNENNTEEELYDFGSIKKDKIIQQEHETKKVTIIKPDNNSGMGEPAPYNIARQYNWGAFLFNFIWGVKYKRWALLFIPFLCFIPYGVLLAIVLAFYAGIKGNQWAWEEVQYKDEADFHYAQKSWVRAWFVFAGIASCISLFIFLPNIKRTPDEEVSNLQNNISNFSSLELRIPDEVFEKTVNGDYHSEFISSNKNIIYWVRPKNTLTEKNKSYIETMYNMNDLVKKNFILYPDLKGMLDDNLQVVDFELEADCKNSVCIDTWLYKTCTKGYCLINPRKRTYFKVRGKSNVIPKALKQVKKWK